MAAALTVGDASCGRDPADAVGAAVFVTLTRTLGVLAPLVGELAAEDPLRGAVEMLELVLLATEFDFVAFVGDEAEVCAAVDVVVEGPAAAVVVALLVEVLGLDVAVVGSVEVVAVPVTEVLAPPEACTTPACGSIDDSD